MKKGRKNRQVKDTVAKLYLQNPELVADLFNVFTFKGERRVSAEMLKPFPTEETTVKLDEAGNETTAQLRRDLSYIAYTDGAAVYFLCVEVQSSADWTMPVRVMRYDAARYLYQIDMRKGQGKAVLLPVFTLVLNLSSGPWNGPRSLHDMMGDIDGRLKKAVPNYSINIADPYTASRKTLGMLCTEIKDVLIYFRASKDRKGFMRFLQSRHAASLSDKAIRVLNTYLDTKLEPQNNERRNTKMCVAWEYFEQQAISKGLNKGLKKGLKKGLTRGRKEGREETSEKFVMGALENNLDYETIHKITGLSLAKIKKIAASVKA